jgi:thiamine pyrophosphate-dependent acetolactate synthase large subunit-like protein
MKRIFVFCLLAAAAVILAAVGSDGTAQTDSRAVQRAGLPADARTAILSVGDDAQALEKSHGAYVKSAGDIDRLVAKLLQKVREVSRLAAEAGQPGSGPSDKLRRAIEEMTEASQGFNLQYLDLQKQMQDENRRYTLISNVMKTKHDTARNAINNIR